jgi:hypothetical protein
MQYALYAEGEAAWTVLGATIPAVLYAMFRGYVWIYEARNANSRQVRDWSSSQQEKIIARLDSELADLRQRMTNAETRAANAERESQKVLRINTRMQMWFHWAAPALRAAGIPVPDFEDASEHESMQGGEL